MSALCAKITLVLPDDQALALAQFVKRVGWSEMRACAADEFETQLIHAAIDQLGNALAKAGYAPR